MPSKAILAAHYSKCANQPNEWVIKIEKTKQSIVDWVLRLVDFGTDSEPVKIAVLGMPDIRHILIHQRVFRNTVRRMIDMKIIDFDTGHLGGESDSVVTHDVTQPFPGNPYDIVFSHELMKFLKPDEQLAAIENSYHALDDDGLAMHALHGSSVRGISGLKRCQYRVNPDELIRQLEEVSISAGKIVFSSGSDIERFNKTTVIILQKAKKCLGEI